MADKKNKKLSKKEIEARQAEIKKQKAAERKKMLSPFEIHVMPQKFNPKNFDMATGKTKKGKGKTIGIIIAIVIVILGLLGYGAFALYQSLNQPVSQPTQTPTTTEPEVTEPETTEPEVTEPETTEPEVTEPETTEPEVTEPETTEPEVTEPEPDTTPSSLPTSTDTDEDGLTDTEENLLGTEVRVADTDGDGFTDGQEVTSLYSPFVSGPISIGEVAAINTYPNNVVGYTLFNPADWLVRPTDASRREVVFTSVTGEVMFLEALDNPNNITIGQWLVDNEPGVNPTTLSNYTTRQGYSGVVTDDELNYYISVPSQNLVYKFTYDPGTVARLNFKSLFTMMVDSLTAQ